MKIKDFVLSIVALAVFSLFVNHYANLRSELAVLKVADAEKQEIEDQRSTSVAKITNAAIQNKDFFAALSPKEAMLWTSLVSEAKESPDSTLFKEYYFDGGTRTIPVTVDVRGDFGVGYTLVVATRTDRMGHTWYTPQFAVYAGSQMGDLFRIDRLREDQSEMRSGREWIDNKRIHWEADLVGMWSKIQQRNGRL
jgi:hypothetical protein